MPDAAGYVQGDGRELLIILVCSRELKITSLYFYLLDGIMEKSKSIFEIEKEI